MAIVRVALVIVRVALAIVRVALAIVRVALANCQSSLFVKAVFAFNTITKELERLKDKARILKDFLLLEPVTRIANPFILDTRLFTNVG